MHGCIRGLEGWERWEFCAEMGVSHLKPEPENKRSEHMCLRTGAVPGRGTRMCKVPEVRAGKEEEQCGPAEWRRRGPGRRECMEEGGDPAVRAENS